MESLILNRVETLVTSLQSLGIGTIDTKLLDQSRIQYQNLVHIPIPNNPNIEMSQPLTCYSGTTANADGTLVHTLQFLSKPPFCEILEFHWSRLPEDSSEIGCEVFAIHETYAAEVSQEPNGFTYDELLALGSHRVGDIPVVYLGRQPVTFKHHGHRTGILGCRDGVLEQIKSGAILQTTSTPIVGLDAVSQSPIFADSKRIVSEPDSYGIKHMAVILSRFTAFSPIEY